MLHTLPRGDYKRKLYQNPHTKPVFYASPRSSDGILVTILILLLDLTSTKKLNAK